MQHMLDTAEEAIGEFGARVPEKACAEVSGIFYICCFYDVDTKYWDVAFVEETLRYLEEIGTTQARAEFKR